MRVTFGEVTCQGRQGPSRAMILQLPSFLDASSDKRVSIGWVEKIPLYQEEKPPNPVGD